MTFLFFSRLVPCLQVSVVFCRRKAKMVPRNLMKASITKIPQLGTFVEISFVQTNHETLKN